INEMILISNLDPYYYGIDVPVYAFVRLTSNATLYFKNLSSEQKFIFSQNLASQLAEVIPIPYNRITTITTDSHYQIESTALNQVLIPIDILESNDTSMLNVSTVFQTLDTL